jgi:DNA adenine methylase
MGGKRLLRKTIGEMIPTDIKGYIEPFGGAAWVMLYKERWADLEVYNDLDGRLVNMFLQVKYHPDELIREMELMPASREIFLQMIRQPGITEIQRAARFIYLVTRSFGSRLDSFATAKHQGLSSHYNRMERIHQLHRRLDKVIIEHLPYADILSKYDCKDNLFYLDPPYVSGATYDNSKGFDHRELRDHLASLKARWILSYDDNALIRELYAGYEIVPVSRIKGINRKEGKNMYDELIISKLEKS